MDRAAYQRGWRFKQGRDYAEGRNEKVKKYQQSFWGGLAQRAGTINTSAKHRGETNRIGGHDLLEIWMNQNGIDSTKCLCADCHKPIIGTWHYDHIIPLFRGGQNEAPNIQILCSGCHDKKSISERRSKSVFIEDCQLKLL